LTVRAELVGFNEARPSVILSPEVHPKSSSQAA